MDQFYYTKSFETSSAVVDTAYYNENTGEVLLDLNDKMYLYQNVPSEAVALLVRGGEHGSVGRHYNEVFKPAFGPAEHLGWYDDVETFQVVKEKTDTTAPTPKGLYTTPDSIRISMADSAYAGSAVGPHLTVAADNSDATPEFSLNVFDHSVSGSPVTVEDEPTREFSLNLVTDEDEADTSGEDPYGVSKVVVHFTLDAYSDRVFKFVAVDSKTVEGAIGELNAYVSKMGATGLIKKVVVKFD